MKYTISLTGAARKDLIALQGPLRARLVAAIDRLQRNPWPRGARKLVGREDSWRFRVGDYRVVYSVYREDRTVTVHRVRHRREVYR